jgi:ATP-dependent Lon protease
MSETVIFPGVKTTVLVPKKSFEEMDLSYILNGQYILSVSTRNGKDSVYEEDDIHNVGTLMRVINTHESTEGYLVKIETFQKVKLKDVEFINNSLFAAFDELKTADDLSDQEADELIKYSKELVGEIAKEFPGAESYIDDVMHLTSLEKLIGYVTPAMNLSNEEKQELLEMTSAKEMGVKFIDLLLKQKESILMQIEMSKKFSDKKHEAYRKQILRNQLQQIQKELGEDEEVDEFEELDQKIAKSKMPKDVLKMAKKELKRLMQPGQNGSEQNVIRTYLETLVALPWKAKRKEIDIEKAREVLNQRHYGMDDVKDRIIQHLAVMKLKKDKQGSILLLVGPPGTGKTSLASSVAEALGRKYVRASLGGVRDEAEVRGHRRTYIGALPGRIINGIKQAGEMNPVFVLDEIDKLQVSYSGDPASALLEVLDPEQNTTFSDHYLEVPYDLSQVFFICTANNLNSIPGPLLDRMEVIQISSYTTEEKFQIAKRHLIPDVLEDHGLNDEMLQISDEAIYGIVDKYTREAGVRGLKKQIAKIARVTSEKIVTNKVDLPYVIKEDMLLDVLGNKTVEHEDTDRKKIAGNVTGLAWTPVGGEVLFIESSFMPGNGKLTLTGQLGAVMKESATIALSLIRSRLQELVTGFEFSKMDIHIHVPAGAIPKDGPSAGITMLTALASLLTNKQVDPKIAMTGEVTLSGLVTPIGGLKEKSLAGYRAGVKKIIFPKGNIKDLTDIPDIVKQEIEFIPVETIEEVLKHALDLEVSELVNYSGHSFTTENQLH